ncbi:hypothetical protein [Agrobacterium pusense]|uniref:hypothetical protein n=1 Tax=Agrobacterium pusense TaxID=648995 RepID=UPI002448D1CD|nr:hypothetical protein [Agrobacterium pusense]MDH0872627.1 hypothetical protein [Agrobacterium pusense]
MPVHFDLVTYVWYSADPDQLHTTIRELTNGAYSHAAIYIGQGQAIDAGLNGIEESSVKGLMNDLEVANVLRWEGEHNIAMAVAMPNPCGARNMPG